MCVFPSVVIDRLLGVHFTLVVLCVRALWRRRSQFPRWCYASIAYVALVLLAGTIGSATSVWRSDQAWILYRTSVSPNPYAIYNTKASVLSNGIGAAAYVVSVWLADFLIVSVSQFSGNWI